ncbi:hypothetical protein DL96DRAFT_1618610 [Flagelloscypha sp. PMI_526]|nr:hypothetical protein DL96DRAFT_1637390 [Flagelloscypha sp. PMI_526]KAH8822654.1 hypothetical protein DL96DRAFT_1618610 [Flagelloscypha sp. PMI_526]
MDDNSTSMAAAALILALVSLPLPPLPLPTVSLAAPCLDADLLAIHRVRLALMRTLHEFRAHLLLRTFRNLDHDQKLEVHAYQRGGCLG